MLVVGQVTVAGQVLVAGQVPAGGWEQVLAEG